MAKRQSEEVHLAQHQRLEARASSLSAIQQGKRKRVFPADTGGFGRRRGTLQQKTLGHETDDFPDEEGPISVAALPGAGMSGTQGNDVVATLPGAGDSGTLGAASATTARATLQGTGSSGTQGRDSAATLEGTVVSGNSGSSFSQSAVAARRALWSSRGVPAPEEGAKSGALEIKRSMETSP